MVIFDGNEETMMVRYQIWDDVARDYIVVGEEEFTRREKEKRELDRRQFSEMEDKSYAPPGTVYFVHTHVEGFYETEEEYTASEQSYRQRCRIPEGSVPRLTRKQSVAWDEFLEKIRTFYKGRIDGLTPELLREYGVDPWRVMSYQRGDKINLVLEALPDGR